MQSIEKFLEEYGNTNNVVIAYIQKRDSYETFGVFSGICSHKYIDDDKFVEFVEDIITKYIGGDDFEIEFYTETKAHIDCSNCSAKIILLCLPPCIDEKLLLDLV